MFGEGPVWVTEAWGHRSGRGLDAGTRTAGDYSSEWESS